MSRALFFIRRALRGIGSRSLIQLAAIGAMAASLVLVGLAVLVAFNVDRYTRSWGRGTQLTVYLDAGVAAERAAALETLLRGRPEIAAVQRVTAAQARARLLESLGGRVTLLEDVEPDFLPLSFEVQLAANVPEARVRALLGLLGAARGVEEVDYLGPWADRFGALMALASRGALLVALIIALGCVYIVASTIRLSVHARREEIEIQKLVGATDGFIRAPLLLEGALQGALGALLAAALLFGLYRWVGPGIEEAAASLLSRIELRFLSGTQVLIGVAAGALLGLCGSSVAVSRYVRV